MTAERAKLGAEIQAVLAEREAFWAHIKHMSSGTYQPASAHAGIHPTLNPQTRAGIARSISMRQRNYLQQVIREGMDVRRGNGSKRYG